FAENGLRELCPPTKTTVNATQPQSRLIGTHGDRGNEKSRVPPEVLCPSSAHHNCSRRIHRRVHFTRKSQSPTRGPRSGSSERQKVSGSRAGVSQCAADRREARRCSLGFGQRLRRIAALPGSVR